MEPNTQREMGKRPAYPLPLPLPIPTWVTRTVHTRCNCSATSNSRPWQTPSTEWGGGDASDDGCIARRLHIFFLLLLFCRASERARAICFPLFLFIYIHLYRDLFACLFFIFTLPSAVHTQQGISFHFEFFCFSDGERDEYYCLPQSTTTLWYYKLFIILHPARVPPSTGDTLRRLWIDAQIINCICLIAIKRFTFLLCSPLFFATFPFKILRSMFVLIHWQPRWTGWRNPDEYGRMTSIRRMTMKQSTFAKVLNRVSLLGINHLIDRHYL